MLEYVPIETKFSLGCSCPSTVATPRQCRNPVPGPRRLIHSPHSVKKKSGNALNQQVTDSIHACGSCMPISGHSVFYIFGEADTQNKSYHIRTRTEQLFPRTITVTNYPKNPTTRSRIDACVRATHALALLQKGSYAVRYLFGLGAAGARRSHHCCCRCYNLT